MSEAALIVGYLVIVVAAVAFAILAGRVVVDAVECGRFIWRVRRAVSASGDKISDWHLFKAWLRYWAGIDYRPRYLTLTANDEVVYWPGHEGSRRYPG